MLIHKDSHIRNHGLTGAQLAFLLDTFADRRASFIEKVTLPERLGTVPCGLVGPIMGDPIVPSVDVHHVLREGAKYTSRMLTPAALARSPHLLTRRTSEVTVIAGPIEDYTDGTSASPSKPQYGKTIERHLACVLYTAFGGPLAPKEPDDPTLTVEQREASLDFWAEHALAF